MVHFSRILPLFLCVVTIFGQKPYGPGHEKCVPPVNVGRVPVYHMMDATCGENDPNGPLWDPIHRLFHLFYQDHIAIAPGNGPVWGHSVSADLAKWTRLPVGLWNDKWYDADAVYTGSSFVNPVNGDISLVYPGICGTDPRCSPSKTDLAIAVPTNRSDPFLTQWSKLDQPVLENIQRDPTTPWLGTDGKPRITFYDGTVAIASSTDLLEWTHLPHPVFRVGECPDFFPLGSLYDPGHPFRGGNMSAWAHKCSYGATDMYQTGTYDVPSDPSSPGVWRPNPTAHCIDQSCSGTKALYASKSFPVPSGTPIGPFGSDSESTRVLFGWARVRPASCQTLPRIVFPTFGDASSLSFAPAPSLYSLLKHPNVVLRRTLSSIGEKLQSISGAAALASYRNFTLLPPSGGWSTAAGSKATWLLRSGNTNLFVVDLTISRSPSSSFLQLDVALSYTDGAAVASTASSMRGSIVVPLSSTAIILEVFFDNTIAEVFVAGLAFTVPVSSELENAIFAGVDEVAMSSAAAFGLVYTEACVQSAFVEADEILRRRDAYPLGR